VISPFSGRDRASGLFEGYPGDISDGKEISRFRLTSAETEPRS